MSPFLQLLVELIIILIAAKAAGYLSARLGQPSVLGEILVGVLLGPSLLDITHLVFVKDKALPEFIHELGELGVLFLMFMAGLELHFNELTRNTRVSALAGTLGVLLPVGAGWGLGRLFGQTDNAAIFLGLAMGATSVSISAQTLMELKMLRSRVGLGLLGAAVFDDILIILLFSAFLALTTGAGNGLVGLLIVSGKMLLFLGLSIAFGLLVLPRLARLAAYLPVSQSVLSLAIIIALIYGVAAEVVGGMAAITGAFIAGLMFSRSHEKERIEPGMQSLAYGFFVPIFFISIGLSVNLRQVQVSAIWLTLAIIATALATKFLGAGLGARLGGLTWREAWQLGAGMISRGEVGLIVASVGIAEGLASQEEFSAIVGMVIVSTLVTPPLLHLLFKEPGKRKGEHPNLSKSKTGEESA